MELTTIIQAATAIREWMQGGRANRRDARHDVDNALRALYTAATETRIYVGHCARRNAHTNQRPARDRSVEEKLAKLWVEASVQIRHVDHDLADRCYIKAEYWLSPEEWTDADIRRAGIELRSVSTEVRELLWT